MLKKISSLLIIALILTAVPAGAALALPQDEEQIVKQEVIMGYFDVWKGSDWLDTNNDGDPDIPGQTGKPTKPFNYDATDKLEEYELTRVVVQYPFTTDEYIAAGGRIYGPNGQPWIEPGTGETTMSWSIFEGWYLTKLPQNLSAQIANKDLSTGSASVQWGLDLPEDPPENALDLKKPENRQYIGYEPADIGSLVEGWRWYLPGIITWYGTPKEQQQNLKVNITSLPSDDPKPGTSVTIKGQVTNESDAPITTLVQWYLDSDKAFEGEVTIDKTRDLTFPFTMPDKDTLVTVQVNPGRNMPPNETTWEDNKDSVTINKSAALEPVLNDNLLLTATSQGGQDQFGDYIPSKQRPAGTAKWTDTITAKLTTQGAPNLGSCYNLKTWKLESATIEYPKMHPDFTFGSPEEPVGTVTKQMNITGNRTATVQFKEDWSLNGAEIFDVLKGRKIPGPTYYNVKVTYKMLWEYSKGHRDCCGEDKCHPCCKDMKDYTKHPTYTVTAKLLVDGTGVNSLAH